MKYLIFLVSISIAIAGCKNKTNDNKQVRATTKDTSNIFVKSLVFGELSEINKVPYFIYVIKQKNNLPKDSTSINNQQLTNYFTPLLKLDIYKNNFTELFSETNFEDLSTESISIIFTPNAKAITNTANVTILLNNKTNQLKNFIAKTITQKNDTTFYIQYHLKAKKSLAIATQAIYNNKEQYSTKEFINWNDY